MSDADAIDLLPKLSLLSNDDCLGALRCAALQERVCVLTTQYAEIRRLMTSAASARSAQRALARSLTRLVHGASTVAACEQVPSLARRAASLRGRKQAKQTQATALLFGAVQAPSASALRACADALQLRRVARQVFARVPNDAASVESHTAAAAAVAARPLRRHAQRVLDRDMATLLVDAGCCESRAAARRLIESGGASLNEQRVVDPRRTVAASDLLDGSLCLVRVGKRHPVAVELI